jgi:nucleoside phosphorylase
MSEFHFLNALRESFKSHDKSQLYAIPPAELSGVVGLLKEDILNRISDVESQNRTPEMKAISDCDILIITPLVMELRMAALAFGRDFDSPDMRSMNLPIFKFELARAGGLRSLRVVLLTLNRQRNLHSGPETAVLLAQYRPRLAVLVGIAGTRNDKDLGEAICASEIIYVAGGVEQPDRKLPEPETLKADNEMFNLMHAYEERRTLKSVDDAFRKSQFERIAKIDGEQPTSDELETYNPKFSVKKLMSGETLRKDGGFTEQALSTDRLISMVEMEAAGFAVACAACKVNWLVFRGSCDYANLEKDNKWQRVAALSAASAVHHCLEIQYRLAEEMSY